MRRSIAFTAIVLLFATTGFAQQVVKLPGMLFSGKIARDANGVTHIEALTPQDMYFLQGYAHAQDRLFQMDYLRRAANGTLGELLGTAALPTDVQLRVMGLRSAAIASHGALSLRGKSAVASYAAGVNAYLATNPALPPEYGALEISKVEPWTALDSVVIAKLLAFQLALDLEDIDRTIALISYQTVGRIGGFDGTKLYSEDLFRSAPFTSASTIPDAIATSGVPDYEAASTTSRTIDLAKVADAYDPAVIELAKDYVAKIRNVPFLRNALRSESVAGSNMWGIAGRHTTNGMSLMANDPHLDLDMPSVWYLNSIRNGRHRVAGHSFAGIPGVVLGHNGSIAWGSTVNPMDQTDIYQEKLEIDPQSPTGFATTYNGTKEWVFGTVQTWRANVIGDKTMDNLAVIPASGTNPPPATLLVTRHGPVISLDPRTGVALTVQHAGFTATRDLDAFFGFNEAQSIDEFKAALQFFDGAQQNWSVIDKAGSIAYFTSGEMPLREDLQAGTINGAPPYFIRNGQGGNEWIRNPSPPFEQALHYQVLPFAEMPQVVNPAAGWFVNGNNDPAGTTLDNNPLNQLRAAGGIFYLNPGYSGFRAGRITQMIKQKLAAGGKFSLADMKAMQADVVLIDAQFFVPYIVKALENAQAAGAHPVLAQFGASPAIVGAVGLLGAWNFTTPTGIPEGFDASDENGTPAPPSEAEIRASVAASIYSVWRGQILKNTVDGVLGAISAQLPRPGSREAITAVKVLLEKYPTQRGRGASGVPFFNVPNVDDADARRDIIILKSLADALGLLSGDAFKDAFNNSTNPMDWRWGKLHRIVLDHPMGGPLSVPSATGGVRHPLGAALPGFSTDGGFEVVDASSHSSRAATINAFMYGSGASNRFVVEAGNGEIRVVETIITGGNSGVPGAPYYMNLMGRWLTNETIPLTMTSGGALPWRR